MHTSALNSAISLDEPFTVQVAFKYIDVPFAQSTGSHNNKGRTPGVGIFGVNGHYDLGYIYGHVSKTTSADTLSGTASSESSGGEPQHDAVGLLERWFRGGKRKAKPETATADQKDEDDEVAVDGADTDEDTRKKPPPRKDGRVSRVGAPASRRRRD